jgi:hypothetical protein
MSSKEYHRLRQRKSRYIREISHNLPGKLFMYMPLLVGKGWWMTPNSLYYACYYGKSATASRVHHIFLSVKSQASQNSYPHHLSTFFFSGPHLSLRFRLGPPSIVLSSLWFTPPPAAPALLHNKKRA